MKCDGCGPRCKGCAGGTVTSRSSEVYSRISYRQIHPGAGECGLASEVIDIRRFEAADFARLLQAEERTWGDALRWDYAPSARIITACLADKRLAGYALVNQGRIEGYSFFVCEDDKGLIGDFFVIPNGGAGQAPRLLEHVLETLLAIPGVRRVATASRPTCAASWRSIFASPGRPHLAGRPQGRTASTSNRGSASMTARWLNFSGMPTAATWMP